MPATDLTPFFTALADSFQQQQFLKLTLSERRAKTGEIKNVFVKPVLLKAGFMLSFVYRYATKDITKNLDKEEAVKEIQSLLEIVFFKADLFTVSKDIHLTVFANGKSIIKQKTNTLKETATLHHNHEKKRYVVAENNIYLRELGVTSAEGKVKNDKQDKYRQINKYIEIVEGIVTSAGFAPDFHIADMGSGKGYLTFALYDYLTHVLNLSPQITGVELREELVTYCNQLAAQAGFDKLHFHKGAIQDSSLPPVDMLIALHACDTATDDAIWQGISSGAKVIICAPCCHKQIRKQLHPTNDLKAITQFGILEERQAEILTDTIRALILEAHGYKTKVFEFISTEHTPKNVLIVGIKTTAESTPNKTVLEQIKNLKALFGIAYHYLEKLAGIM